MRETIIGVTAKIKNIPDNFDLGSIGWMVVRRMDTGLWYYGFYENEEKANQVAIEINNGVVVKL